MFRTIVVGYEGPDRGDEAIALAEVLRDQRNGTLLLTSAYPPAPLPMDGFVAPEDLRDEAENALADARDRLEGRVPAHIISVPADSPARALTEVSEAERADLVVIGSSHRGALGRVVPGTTAERLLHGAPCAVAVPPRGYKGGDVRHVGVAYDGSPEAEAALHVAEAIALERSAALSVYCVVEPTPQTESMIAAGTGGEWPSQAAKGRARRLLSAVSDNAPQGLKPETVLLHGPAAEEIARRVHGVVDLLFVGSWGYGPLRRVLLGSVSGALVRDAGCPVIIIPRTAVGPRRAPEAAAAARA